MGKRSTIVAVTAMAILIAGIVLAVVRLYRPGNGEPVQELAPAGWSVLSAIPSDAAAIIVFDGSSKAARVMADSSAFLAAFLAGDNPALMPFLQSLGRRRIAVSLHNSGSLVPLVAAESMPGDSLLCEAASRAGLKSTVKDGFLLASRSETFINAALRHLEEGSSVLGTRHLQDLVRGVSGPAVLFLSHAHAGKLVQVYGSAFSRSYTSFVKDITPWSAWIFQDPSPESIGLKGTALPGDAPGSYFGAYEGFGSARGEFPEVLPYYTGKAVSLPLPSPEAFLEARRRYEDGLGRLAAYEKALRTRGGRPLCPEEWFLSLQPREVVKAAFVGEDGIGREVLLVRSAKDLKLGKETPNPYRGCLATLLGPRFAVTDTVCSQVNARWTAFADLPTVRLFQDKSFLDYSLKNRLLDASLDTPDGFVVYASLGDAPQAPERIFSPVLAAPLNAFVRGAGYAPAMVSLDLSGERPVFQARVSTRVLKGSKVQVLERDTTVVVPTGLFPVTNYLDGKTNYLYQNAQKSICLNDENGKGVWGIPFKEDLCGRVVCIDYYNNKKLQFLFAAGNKLYLLDRLGHWVKDFPATLPKPVLLGPDAYDFTGAGGYTVMVLHRDNSLERYNLHGQKPQGWQGIRAPETVKNLPELLESKGKRYWAVRTSVRTLIYPFEGGEPLTREEGGRMIKPDAVLQPTSRGVQAECYDGRTRDIKLN